MISTSTMYRKRVQTIESQTAATNELMLDDNRVRLHWVDNYARFIKANCLWYRQDILRQLLWTAHGFKSLPIPVSMTWKLDHKNQPIVAMPPLEDLLSSKAIASLHGDLSRIRLQKLEGFGIEHHRRSAMYSVIHVDVSIMWHLFRMLYSYEGVSGIHRSVSVLWI